MAHEVTAFPGCYLFVLVDSKLRADLAALCQRRFGSEVAKAQDAREQLLAHPYLVADEWHAAERRYEKNRYTSCRKLLPKLIGHLEAGTVLQLGLDGVTGQAELTAKRLKDRHVQLLDLAPGCLLIKLERHPKRGSDIVQMQHWLYSSDDRYVRLLEHHPDEAPGLFLVQRAGSRPGPPTTERRDSFYRLVEHLLGSEWVSSFEGLLRPDKPLLARPSREVLEHCSEIIGIDCQTQEAASVRERRLNYERTYGPRASHFAFSIDHQVGIRLGFPEPESDPT